MKKTLSLPPTINSYYSQSRTGRRFKTAKAKAWEIENGYLLLKCKKLGKSIIGVIYKFYMPDNRSDYNNRAKIIDDLLEKQGIIDNDKQILEGHLYKYIDKDNPRVEIEVYKL